MSKLITVFGATGNQGGSVIKSIQADPVLSKEFKIRGITRDVTKASAQALAAKGVEVVQGDMSSKETILPAIQGSDTVFLVTNFWETMSAEVEVSQGKAVADASKEAGVKHLIFSSLLNTTKITEGRLPNIAHFVGKADIEQYIRDIGVPATFVLLGIFMSGIQQNIRKNPETGIHTLALPLDGNTGQIPIIDATSDTGRFTVAAIKNFPAWQGKRILAADAYYTPNQIVDIASEVLGKPVQYGQLPGEVFKGFLPPPVAQELLENFLLLGDVGYYNGESLDASRAIIDGKTKSWKEYVAEHKDEFA